MQISYHSALTKIQKLQNLKKKKKIMYWPVLPEIGRYLNQYEMLTFRYRYTYRYGTYRSVRLVPVRY